MTRTIAALAALLALATPAPAQTSAASDQDEALAVAHLALHARGDDDTLASGERALSAYLDQNPANDHARLALGIVQFLRSGEHLFQFFYNHGAGDQQRNQFLTMGLMMRPVPMAQNPDPKPVTHMDVRDAIAAWISDVQRAEQTLAAIRSDDVKLRVMVGMIRMDFDGDGKASDQEHLWQFFAALRTRFNPTPDAAAEFDIAFDRGDADWLRGYCHLCMAAGEMILAHDTEPLFNHTAQLFFADPQTPYPFLRSHNVDRNVREMATFTDLVALIHLLSFDVIDPDAMRRAHAHLQSCIDLGHSMWDHYQRETDDDREWIPTPNQKDAALPNARVDQNALDTWLAALDEADAILDGTRLIRFWRGDGSKGINFKRIFHEPQRFDLVLWIQGAAAGPYLEEGDFTTPNTWRNLTTAFDRRVFRNMFWLN